MYEKLEELYKPIQEFISQNPHYGYLIAAAGFAVFFLGYLYRWSWIINPEGSSRSVFLYETFGVETMRKIMIVITAIITISCLAAFYLSKK